MKGEMRTYVLQLLENQGVLIAAELEKAKKIAHKNSGDLTLLKSASDKHSIHSNSVDWIKAHMP